MPRSSIKSSKNSKGKDSADKKAGKHSEQNLTDCDRDDLDNECKQKKKGKRKSVKKDIHAVEKSKIHKNLDQYESNSTGERRTAARIPEDGSFLEIEVEGQAMDFNSEVEGDMDSESGEESISEEEGDSQSRPSINNNASRICEDEDAQSEVVIRKPTKEEERLMAQQEEKEMLRFIELMKKQGLVLVDTLKLAKQGQDKIDQKAKNLGQGQGSRETMKNSRKGKDFVSKDVESVATIYHNAVEKESSK